MRSITKVAEIAEQNDIKIMSEEYEIDSVDIERGDVFAGMVLTPFGDELVVVEDITDETITLTFEDRTTLNSDGEETEYTYETFLESFGKRVNADDGWYEVPHSVKVETPNCSNCGSFMHVHTGAGEDVFSSASCPKCEMILHHDSLVKDGAIVEILL